ncbi:hypothetical protein ACNI5A_28965, partial [Klebsiella pneumoniae]
HRALSEHKTLSISWSHYLKSFVKNRSFRQDTVAQLNNAPLPRSGSGKKRRSWTLSIKILETLHGY